MDVDPVASMNGLRTVTARELDGWIAKTLQPSPQFSAQVKETVWQICEFLKRKCFEDNIHVQKTVKGGSAGKGTALKNKSDADVVLFLTCLPSYEDQKRNRKVILDLIMERLKDCRESLQFDVFIGEPRYKGPDSTPRSLSLTLSSMETGESIDVDILPAYDALGQVTQDASPNPEVYVRLLHACSHPGEFSPCFTELQKMFVKHRPAKLKDLLRLVKYWYKELLKPQHPNADLPPKYALELLTIYAWEEGIGSSSSFDMAQGFRTVLELLGRHRDICIYWEKYYSLQHREIGAHVKGLLSKPRPVILDPADPTGILGQDKDWNLMAQAAASYCNSLPCLANIQPWNVQPARPVTIEVMQLSGTRLTQRVSPYTTIWQLKEVIHQNWGISPYTQRLAQQEPGRSNITLQDCDTLATHGIFYNTTLVLLQTEAQRMQVFVKDDKNRTMTYTVLPTDTVRQLKEQIQARQGPPANEQRLTYGSRELQDQHTLEHYDVRPMSTIYMLLRLRGGADPQLP
ncbi:2'-5'-oligoadenylate synthase 1-like isoform X2 [Serinus canaria]|uniref:2'-5'-oligoadenylate synthetase like n=1 Tax=Serinus canaria TaxID=9135 RepID=A0A8C9NXV6_SERCA|nr:2'-5'-oligoadenylate synthase 1-like isoform X2 [Serinus canaria]